MRRADPSSRSRRRLDRHGCGYIPEALRTGGGADSHIFNARGRPASTCRAECGRSHSVGVDRGARCRRHRSHRAGTCRRRPRHVIRPGLVAARVAPHEDRRRQGDQARRVPGRAHAGRRTRAGGPGTRGRGRARGGTGSAFADAEYVAAGAEVVAASTRSGTRRAGAQGQGAAADELAASGEGQMLFTYLHLAPDPELTQALIASGATGIAYETVETADRPPAAAGADERGRRAPRRRRRAPLLEHRKGGMGCCSAACRRRRRRRSSCSAAGSSAPTPRGWRSASGGRVVLDRSIDRMRELDADLRRPRDRSLRRPALEVEERDREADLVIGAVLVPGAQAPKLVTREHAGLMKPRLGARRRRDRPGRLLRDLPPRPPTPTRPTWSTGSSTTASPTCRAPCRSPRRARSRTPRSRTSSSLADQGFDARHRTFTCPRARRQRRRGPGHLGARCRGSWSPVRPACRARRQRGVVVKKLPSRGLERAGSARGRRRRA